MCHSELQRNFGAFPPIFGTFPHYQIHSQQGNSKKKVERMSTHCVKRRRLEVYPMSTFVPLDVMKHILSFAEDSVALRMRWVCKYWHMAFEYMPIHENTLYMRMQVARLIIRFFRDAERTHITDDYMEEFYDEFLSFASRHRFKVQALRIFMLAHSIDLALVSELVAYSYDSWDLTGGKQYNHVIKFEYSNGTYPFLFLVFPENVDDVDDVGVLRMQFSKCGLNEEEDGEEKDIDFDEFCDWHSEQFGKPFDKIRRDKIWRLFVQFFGFYM